MNKLLRIITWLAFHYQHTYTTSLDLCALGHDSDADDNQVVNGMFLYGGIDSSNSSFWIHKSYGDVGNVFCDPIFVVLCNFSCCIKIKGTCFS